MRNKDVKFLTEAYEAIREKEHLKESNPYYTLLNIGLANYFKKYLLEFTVGDKPPAGMTNVNVTGANSVNPYEPATPVQGTTASGAPLEIYGTEREMKIERAAIESTRALLIFLTFLRLNPMIQVWLRVFAVREVEAENPLTPEEEVEFERLLKLANNWEQPLEWDRHKKDKIRFYELRKKHNQKPSSNFEYIASEKDRIKARQHVYNLVAHMAEDLPEGEKIKKFLDDIVEFMIAFLGTNPNAIEMLDLPKYTPEEKPPEQETQNHGHSHSPSPNIILQLLPHAIETAISIFGVSGAAVAGAAAVGGYYVGKTAITLLKNLKEVPKKALALIMGNRVKPAALPDRQRPVAMLPDKPRDKKEEGNIEWEIETNDGKFEPLPLEDKK